MAEGAYDSDALRQSLAARGASANVKPLARRKDEPAFSAFPFRYRNLVERFFNKLKHSATLPPAPKSTVPTLSPSSKLASAKSRCGLSVVDVRVTI